MTPYSFFSDGCRRCLHTFTVLAAMLWACLPASAELTLQAHEQVYDLRTQQAVSTQAWVSHMQQADVLLLGEIHDNPRHHQVRADILRRFNHPRLSVVAEHLPADEQALATPDLLSGLQAAGFNAQGWRWPLHQPVFEAAFQGHMRVFGGNLRSAEVKGIYASKGESAPAGLKVLLANASLDPKQLQALRHEIDQGHCGALPASQFDNMVAVQRARDAVMAQAALQHLPAVVLAGNGHVWQHLGVPQVLRANRPELTTVSVLFMEAPTEQSPEQRQAWLASLAHQADWVWVGAPMDRPDPCLAFKAKP